MQSPVRYNIPFSKYAKRLIRYKIPNETTPREMTMYDMTVVEDLEEAVELSVLGNPIAFPIKFIGGTYRKYDKNGALVDIDMPDFRLPALVIGTFSRKKLTQITDMGSGRSSVKELNGHSDWSIELSGIITPEENHPQGITGYVEMLRHMKEWDDCMSSIDVSSELLTALGIYRVVINDLNFGQTVGISDNCEFSMSLLSDEYFELEIIE